MPSFGVRLRMVALICALAVMGTAIAAVMWNFHRQTGELRARLANIDAESGRMAAQFKDRFREVSNARLQYAVTHDPAVWRQFLEANHTLSEWIEARAREATTPEERAVLAEVKAAYAQYYNSIGEIPGEPGAAAPQNGVLAAYSRVRLESQHLFDLGENLANAHYRSRDQLVAETRARLGGLQRSVLALVAVLFILGGLLGYVAYRDLISPLRLRLVASQSLVERQEKLASLGMLAAGVAHEIRNPLTAIKAALYIQQKRFQPGTPEHADGEFVQREISRLERIVTDFLRFARPAEPTLGKVTASEILQDVRQFFLPQLADTNIRLTIAEAGPWAMQADTAQIKQVLINLVQNAIDSVGESGAVTLRARRDRKLLGGENRAVVILEVADTGKGIAPDVSRRLFDPFFTTKEQGTGLGLSIAARIVEKHRGALQYQTQLNRGTTFGVVLPEVFA